MQIRPNKIIIDRSIRCYHSHVYFSVYFLGNVSVRSRVTLLVIVLMPNVASIPCACICATELAVHQAKARTASGM